MKLTNTVAATAILLLAATSAASHGRMKRQALATTTTEPTTISAANTETTTTSQVATSTAKPKTPPVNFTQVNDLFEAAFNETEVIRKWQHMDKQITDAVRSILKAIFPHVVAMSSDAKVSGACSGAILKWILNLRNLRSWAVKMLDAIGKPSAGILEGSLTMFGNYHECLSVRAPDEDEIELVEEFREYFRGQYCVLQMRPYLPKKPTFYSLNSTIESLFRPSYKYYEKNVYDDLAELAMAFNFVNIRADLCVPSLCSRDDIQRVADFIGKKVDMRARVLRCDVELMDDQTQIEEQHVIWFMLIVILVLLVLISTLTNMVFNIKKKSSKGKAHSLFTSMSIYRSLSHIKDIQLDRINDSKPIFLYSLKLIIILWIFLTSLTSQLNFQYLRELLSLRDLIMLWPMQLIVNSTLQFDALILLTAFTYSYQNIQSNIKDLIKYNLSKYFRLMPSIMLFVAITIITPILYQNKSPIWKDFVDEPADICKTTGLINLTFLQNFLNYSQICLPQTWIFCVEFQLCLLSIPLVYLLNKQFDENHGKIQLNSLPVLSLFVVAIVGCVINFMNIYSNSLPGAWFQTFPDKDDKSLYFSKHLFKTWTHLTTFAVGLFAGHLCRCLSIETFSGRPYGRKCCDVLMLLTSFLLMAIIIYATHSWSLSGRSHLEAPIMSALYGSLAPLFWSISWSLILFHLTVPNEKNQKSTLTYLLTSDVNLVRLGRLSFLAYLINPYINSFILAVQEQAIFSSILMLGHFFLANVILTFALAFVVSALVELPCRRLFKKLLLGSRRQCTNLDIITRQLNIHQQNQGPSHDSFNQDHSSRHLHHQYQQQQKQQMSMSSQPMIPMK